MDNKRRLHGRAIFEYQDRYGKYEWYGKIVFDDPETNVHYKIKMHEWINGEVTKLLMKTFWYNQSQAETEAKKRVDFVLQWMSNLSKKSTFHVQATPMIDIPAAIAAK